MAILNVTANHDYRPDTVSNVDQIHFEGVFTAIFDQSQFGGGGISNSLFINGGVSGENRQVLEVHLSPGGTGFSAAGWSVSSAGTVVIRMIGTALDDVMTGTDAGAYSLDEEFIGGGGADTLIGGTGRDLFIYAATGEVEVGEKIDGGGLWEGEGSDTISVRATNDFRGSQITDIEWVEILGAGTIATFSWDQLRVPFDDSIEKNGMNFRGERDGGTVQSLVVQAQPTGYPSAPDAYANLKYYSFYDWGQEDLILVNGTSGADFLTGSDVADHFDAGAGNDELFGRQGKDTLAGGAGRDRLDGGADKDVLAGGADKDAFVFAAPLKGGKNVDHITDFAPGTDIIRLEREDFVGLDKGKLDQDAFVSGGHASKAKDAQDRIVYDETTGALYFDKDGKGGAKAVKFAVLDGAPHLEAGDIIVFA